MPKHEGKIRNNDDTCKLEDEDSGSDNTSGLSSLVYSGSNEEEYLRATWTKLGVGHDGYLSLEELTKVCYAIGMEKVASEVIEQLFSRLDVDGDGRISFEEFFHMFKSGGPSASASFNLDDSQNQDSSLLSSSSCLPSVSSSGGIFCTDCDIFSTLDPEGTGQVSVSRLVEVWFSLGVNDGCRVLRELGLPHRHGERVYLKDLAAVFEEEWRPQQDHGTGFSRQVTLLTLLYEVKGLRACLEAARGERDKCRWDLNEANNRLIVLAQDLDEHNTRIEENTQYQIQSLEKQYRDQVRELQESLSRERASGSEKALDESKELQNLNIHFQEEETKLKCRIGTLESDVKRLEVENLDLCEKLKASDYQMQSMERQISQLNLLKNKLAEYESLSPREDEFRTMVQRMEELFAENQILRDSNDELQSQLEVISSKQLCHNTDERSLDGSCIGDYFDQTCDGLLPGGLKRRVFRSSAEEESSGPEEDSPRESKIRKKSSSVNGVNIHYIDVTSYDESFLDTSLPSTSLDNKESSQCTPSNFGNNESERASPLSSLNTAQSSQPCSLPVNLLQSPAVSNESTLRKKLDKRKKIEELEKEVEALKLEKERLNKLVAEVQEKKGITDRQGSISEPSGDVKKVVKCPLCIDLEKRLTLMMEELEMALRRETQYQAEKADDQALAMNRMQLLIDHCKELEEELTHVKTDVLKLIEERDQLLAEKENMKLEIHQKNNESISAVVETLCRELIDKILNKRKLLSASYVDSQTDNDDDGLSRDAITTILEEEEPAEDEEDEEEIHRHLVTNSFTHKEEEMELEFESPHDRVKRAVEKLEVQVNLLVEDMIRERDGIEKQKAIAEERCVKAEHDLEVVRCEFVKSEDYWNLKLAEEQEYYDEERKLYDEKFTALEAKIKEYEETALNAPEVPTEIMAPSPGECGTGSDDSDRLSTIDESVVWEKQVTELEEEVAVLHKKLQLLKEQKDNLEQNWKEKFAAEKRNSELETKKLQYELEQSRALFSTLESQANYNKEQLEHLQKNFIRHSSSQTAEDSQNKASSDEAVMLNLRSQLVFQQKRTKQLENALKSHQKNSTELIKFTNEHHNSEIQSLQAMMSSTQQMFSTNLAKYKDQLSRATKSDNLIRELYIENAQLMVALQVTEARQKEAEESVRKFQMAALSSSSEV